MSFTPVSLWSPGTASNFFHYANDPPGALVLHITPSLSFTTLTRNASRQLRGKRRPQVVFHGGFAVTYNEFFGVGSNEQGVNWSRLPRNVSGALDPRARD